MKKEDQVWFGMRLTPEEKSRIKRLALLQGISAKAALLDLVDRELERIDGQKGTFFEGIEDLIGSVEGPGDLSTNPKYMEGYGEDIDPY
ncbi:MAG: hypothetical protein JJ896_10395 [Rhodothermales bacterium]|nr:hypothetical protein [Rhodothermales bacterium]MBO6780050.1 hypothetical protein [Rhodothermales bacterium]